ncbi:MAG: tripartite tricarboxylate transporter substrate binding protein [Rubritepida sp.]|nr:tripartite tricarboxylate transporter substrate binding protein [Rubritepida sp.]
MKRDTDNARGGGIPSWRLGRRAMLGAVAGLTAPALASAQSFPERSLRMIMPYTPGGATDSVARLVAQRMSESLQQQVVVENRSGAGGTLGTGEAARATPDGYTIAFGNISTLVLNTLLYRRLPYDPMRDMLPLALIAYVPNVLVVGKDVPVTNLAELIAYIKAKPGEYNYGSAGNGTIMHLASMLFQQLTGTEMSHVPYRGSIPALQDVIAGRLLMMIDNVPGPLGLIQGGALKALAVTSEQRVSVLPDVPTVAEAGLPFFSHQSWFGLCTQKDVPAPIRARLEAAALEAVRHPATQQRLRDLGTIPAPKDAGEFGDFWRAEMTFWRPVAASSQIVLD